MDMANATSMATTVCHIELGIPSCREIMWVSVDGRCDAPRATLWVVLGAELFLDYKTGAPTVDPAVPRRGV